MGRAGVKEGDGKLRVALRPQRLVRIALMTLAVVLLPWIADWQRSAVRPVETSSIPVAHARTGSAAHPTSKHQSGTNAQSQRIEGSSVCGSVTFDGKPTGDAHVLLYARFYDATSPFAELGLHAAPLTQTVTDASGKYCFAGLSAGTYWIQSSGHSAQQFASISVALDDNCSVEADLVLKMATKVTGTVVDDNDEPVAEADVQALAKGCGLLDLSKSDEFGRFTMPLTVAEDTLRFFARRGEQTGVTELASDALGNGVAIKIGALGSLSGLVVSPESAAVGNAKLLVMHEDSGATSFTSECGPDGRFQFNGLPAGRYSVIASHDAVFSMERLNDELRTLTEVHPGRATTGVKVLDLSASNTLMGCVSDSDGNVIAGAKVFLSASYSDSFGWCADSDVDGSFTLRKISPGTYHLSVDAAGYFANGRDIAIPCDSVQLVLASSPLLEGIVKDAANGQGIPGARVGQFCYGDPAPVTATPGFSGSTISDENGRLVLDQAKAEGPITYCAEADGYAAAWKTVNIARREAHASIEFNLERNGKLTGTVLNETGSSIRNAQISAYSAASDTNPYVAVSNNDGKFELESLPVGVVELAVSHDTHARVVAHTNISPGHTSNVRVVMPNGLLLEGRITQNGEPVKYASIEVTEESDNASTRHLGASEDDGIYRVRGLSPGQANVTVKITNIPTKQLYTSRVYAFRIGSGVQNRLDIDVPGGAGPLFGQASAGGRRLPGAYVTIVPDSGAGADGNTFTCFTDAAGYYDLSSLPSGPATLRVTPCTVPTRNWDDHIEIPASPLRRDIECGQS